MERPLDSPFHPYAETTSEGYLWTPIQSSPLKSDVALFELIKHLQFFAPSPFDHLFKHELPLLCCLYPSSIRPLKARLFLMTSTHVDSCVFVYAGTVMKPLNWWRQSHRLMNKTFFDTGKTPLHCGDVRFDSDMVARSL